MSGAKITSCPAVSIFSVFYIIVLRVCLVHAQADVFEVSAFGCDTSGDMWDITESLVEAWRLACETKDGIVVIPRGTFSLNTVTLGGPCNGSTTFVLNGNLKAPIDISEMGKDSQSWMLFLNMKDLFIIGRGSFDGQGMHSWLQNQCKRYLNCKSLPTSLELENVTNALVEGITSIDSKFFHIALRRSESILIKNVVIQAPGYSHNTDGIHISLSKNIIINKADIGTGDDCISLSQGSRNIHIYQIRCGPGHGISIGSLGNHAHEEDVSDILVNDCTFTNTTNGARIKTWAPSFPSRVFNLTFADITLNNVTNPILIDQHYCPNSHCTSKGESEVHISKVEFHNFTGSSPNKEAVTLNCSSVMPCEAIVLGELNIRDNLGGPTTLTCTNVHGISFGSTESSIICADNGIAPNGEVVGTSPIGMAPGIPHIGAPIRAVGIAPNGVDEIAPCTEVVYAPVEDDLYWVETLDTLISR